MAEIYGKEIYHTRAKYHYLNSRSLSFDKAVSFILNKQPIMSKDYKNGCVVDDEIFIFYDNGVALTAEKNFSNVTPNRLFIYGRPKNQAKLKGLVKRLKESESEMSVNLH